MFWRLWLRSLTVKRPQALLALVSLALGAAVASMLLNLYGDVHRKMTEEFRAYGANVILAPASETAGASGVEDLGSVMDTAVLSRLDSLKQSLPGLSSAPMLYVVTRASSGSALAATAAQNVVSVGTDFGALRHVNPSWRMQGSSTGLDPETCAIGARLASSMGLKLGDSVTLSTLSPASAKAQGFRVRAIVASGASEDDQVFVPLDALQRLAGLGRKLSLVEVNVPGDARAVENTVREISVPGVDVRAIRQIVSSEGKVLATIRWLLLSLTALILAIVVLSVISTITVILLERRRDVAVMKSLGASNRMVTRLFLTEVAALGLVGGLIGFGAGALAARDIGRRLFGIALSPDWWMLPVVCAACILAMILSTVLPLGTVRSVDPALVLKGE